MAAPPLLLRSRASIRAVSMILRSSKNSMHEPASSSRRRSCCAARGIVVGGGGGQITSSEFELLFGVDATSPQRDCFGSAEVGSLRGVPELGMGSTRHLNAFMTRPGGCCLVNKRLQLVMEYVDGCHFSLAVSELQTALKDFFVSAKTSYL